MPRSSPAGRAPLAGGGGVSVDINVSDIPLPPASGAPPGQAATD